MSYRDPKQLIEGPSREIMTGIEKFRQAVLERIRSGEWTRDHMEKLIDLRTRLTAFEAELAFLAEESW